LGQKVKLVRFFAESAPLLLDAGLSFLGTGDLRLSSVRGCSIDRHA
jgi:hypothetical protein